MRKNRSERYRERAEELRSAADGMSDESARAALLRSAESYERMAERAEQEASTDATTRKK